MARSSQTGSAANDYSGDQPATKFEYETIKGDEGFTGTALVRKVYNDLLALHQRKANIESASAWGQNCTPVDQERSQASVIPFILLPYVIEDVGEGNRFSKKWFLVHPLVVADYICALMKLEEVFGAAIFSDGPKPEEQRIPSNAELYSYYETVKATDKKENVRRELSATVLQAACRLFMTNGKSTIELIEMYFWLAKRGIPEAVESWAWGPMDTYRPPLCPQCCMYYCTIHEPISEQ